MQFTFGQKRVCRLARSSVGSQVPIGRLWRRWIHIIMHGDLLIFRLGVVAFIFCRSEFDVWSEMYVSSGDVFVGHSSPDNANVVSLVSCNPVGDHFVCMPEIVAIFPCGSEFQGMPKMRVSSTELYCGQLSQHGMYVVSLSSWNIIRGPFDVWAINCRVLSVKKWSSSLVGNACFVWRGIVLAFTSTWGEWYVIRFRKSSEGPFDI